MKKTFGIYGIVWAICLALFNVIVFVTPSEVGKLSKFGGAFWVGYIFIALAFIGQLVCAFITFKGENSQKVFYRIPLISVSYTGLILMLIAGTACMAIPNLPNWVGIIICILILAFNATAILKATAAAEIVSDVDKRVAAKTELIKSLTDRAHILMNQNSSEETKKIYEALRYSDPVDSSALAECNSRLLAEFNAFADAVNSEDSELIKSSADSLLHSIESRNLMCKAAK